MPFVARSRRPLSIALVLFLATVPLAALAQVPQVPCSDDGKCPDLVVDASRLAIGTQRNEAFGSGSCAVQEGMIAPGTRQVLRFTFNSPNVGEGDLKIGNPADHPEWFEWAPCHNHYHFRQYADYRLWTVADWQTWQDLRAQDPQKPAAQVLAENPGLQFRAGSKMGFCVIDIEPGVPPNTHGMSLLPQYTSCSTNQGISKGWADEYLFTLDGQWIDVTGLPTGPYILEAEVNAEHLYLESEYGNNWASIPVVVT